MELLSMELLIFVAAFAACCVVLVWKRLTRLPLPPKPYQLSASSGPPWKIYANWSKSIGPMMSLSMFGSSAVVLDSTEIAFDLLHKRSIYSSRPKWPLAELLGRQNNVGFQYYGERLRKSRKILHAALNANAVGSVWDDLLHSQNLKLLRQLLSSPEGFYNHIQKNIQEITYRFIYGTEPEPEYFRIAAEVKNHTSAAWQPRRWMVIFIPALSYVPSWVPGAGFQRWAKGARELFYRMTRTPFVAIKKEMEQGIAGPSFVQRSLLDLGPFASEGDEDIVMTTAGSLFAAGSDTVVAVILTFFLMMARHPEHQHRAYQEILEFVGTHRLPGLEDRAALSYIECIIKEVHRFNPVISLVIHSNTEEDSYAGYRIPKDSWVMANVWSMLHNEEAYPDAENFVPERFLPSEGHDIPRDPTTLVYGFGRRICPGIHLANTLIYLNIARVLALFEIGPEVKNGEIVQPSLAFTPGLVSTPKVFRCSVKLRPHAYELLYDV